ncbi:MAG: N-acetylmuramoyl-L-alanine amidase [Rhodospirillales bacterium]|nr:N-acetylmuramoyl-L-alanine amidase [Rhodospirillales bacterium]
MARVIPGLGRVRSTLRAGVVVLAAIAIGGVCASAAAKTVVTDVRAGAHDGITRLVLDMTDRVEFHVFTLVDPYRVVIDLAEVGWRLPQLPLPRETGLLKSLRYGLFKPGQSRLVMDTSAPAIVNQVFLMEPAGRAGFRLVLDMTPTSRDAMLASIRAQSPPASGIPRPDSIASANARAVPAAITLPFAPPPRKPERNIKKRTVALDPGHGGVDPGAVGTTRVFEKHITLAATRALKQALEETGRYRVVLTRDRDIFIPLRDRIAVARKSNAELFLSIHADSIRDRNVRGLSVYTLSENASDKEAAEIAQRENKADLIAGIDLSGETAEVTNILIDLAQRETMNQSAEFAARLVRELGRGTRMLRNTHRFAGFVVLKAPDVPSVLVELGFLSNGKDEAALKKPQYRAALVRAIVRAVEGYFARIEEASRPNLRSGE